jgi:hypothetical protein
MTATECRPVSLDARSLLRRIDRRIVALRRAISHDHRDAAYWSAVGTTAAVAQSERAVLRMVANLLHVERATNRGRLHGTRFASLDEQRTWLKAWETVRCARAARYAGLPDDATLVRLRIGELLDLPRTATTTGAS